MKQKTYYETWSISELLLLQQSFESDSKNGSLSSFEEWELEMVNLEIYNRK